MLAAGAGAGISGSGVLQAIAATLNLTLDMEGYNTAQPIDGQDGWNADGAATTACGGPNPYDHHFEAVPPAIQALAPGFDTKALRVSNAVTSGCFGDQTYTKPLANEAGESAAENGGLSGGVRSAYYEVEWQVISAVPNAEQPGLTTSFSPDRGDGARMSYIRIEDKPTGLDFYFDDFHDGDFDETLVATGLARNTVHTVKLTMVFVEGQTANDIVRVFIDGSLVKTGTSWENYFKEVIAENPPSGNPPRTVDSLLVRSGGTAQPANAGKGFYLDNIKLTSGLKNVFVQTDGSDTNCDGTAAAASTGSHVCAVQTIARGLQLAAQSADATDPVVVNVGPGTYNESTVVLPNKNTLTIKGTDTNNRPIIAKGLTVGTQSDLTLKDLIIQGSDDSGSVDTYVINGGQVTNFTMTNVKIDGEGVAKRHGVAPNRVEGTISITNSQFNGITGFVAFDTRPGSGGPASGANIVSGTFNNNTLTNVKGHINFRATVTASPAAVIEVKDNTWTGTGNFDNGATGLLKIFYAASATITGNTFKDVGTDSAAPASFQTEIGAGNGYGAAILPRNVGNLVIQNNLFQDDNQGIAFEVQNDSSGGFPRTVIGQTTISNNTFLNTKFGIYIPSVINPASDLTLVNVSQNSFNSNVAGAQALHNGSPSEGTIKAETNWWGASSGPQHSSNPGATGLIVTDGVDFNPFLGHGTDTSANIGFQPDLTAYTTYFVRLDGSNTGCDGTADVAFNASLLGACAVATGQKGADNAPAGGTVQFAAGTWQGTAGQINVGTAKALAIQGASRATTIIDGQNGPNKTGGRGISFTVAGTTGATVKNLTVRNFSDHGIYGQGPITNFTVDTVESSNNGDATAPNARGIVVWNGLKNGVTITNSIVNNNGVTNSPGIGLQDGSATNVTITGNHVEGNSDAGIFVLGPGGPGTNLIANNDVLNNGRFGIDIALPNGNGAESGGGSVIIDGNTVSRTLPATRVEDHSGISVIRRSSYINAENIDHSNGVVIRNNVVSGIHANAPSSTGEGFCIVVEGTNMAVHNNIVSNCDVGIQMQKGNTLNQQGTTGFDRGDAPDYSGAVEQNSIATNNGVGMRGVGLTTASDATHNWWGNASGPTNAANAGGTGASVVGNNVAFSPWLADGTDTNAAIGFQPNLTPVGFLPTQGINVAPTSGLVTTENGGTAQFAVVLASAPTANVTIGLSSSNTNEGTVNPTSLTFTSGNWNVPQTVTVTGNALAPNNGNVAYTIITAASSSTDPNFNGLNPADVAVTNNASPVPSISVAPTSGLVTTENGGTAQFAVVLAAPPSANVTIPLSSSNTNEGTVNPTSLTFTQANWNTPQTVTVTGNALAPNNGNVAYTIVTAAATSSDPSYNGMNAADVAVTNNAAAVPSISIADASVTEGDSGLTNITFNVTLSQASPSQVTVNYATQDQTAVGGPSGDYLPASGTVTFAPGETSKPIVIQIKGDTTNEPNETFLVNLSNASGGTIADGQAVGTIQGDDINVSQACSPRPNITVQTQAIGGHQQLVTVRADTAAPNQANVLTTIQFGTPTNATIQVPGQASVGTAPITLAAGSRQLIFTVTQTDTSAAFNVPFTISDSCGGVQKFVGGGKSSLN